MQHMQWWWLFKRRHNLMLNKHHAMTSFPLLLRCMGVFIFVLIHSWLLVHRPLLHIINSLFKSLNVCFSLLITFVHSPTTCKSHSNSLAVCYIWSMFLISSPHHTYYTSVTSWWMGSCPWFLYIRFFIYGWFHLLLLTLGMLNQNPKPFC
jgi:hypothetical protein